MGRRQFEESDDLSTIGNRLFINYKEFFNESQGTYSWWVLRKGREESNFALL
jgi:hypothetical protein